MVTLPQTRQLWIDADAVPKDNPSGFVATGNKIVRVISYADAGLLMRWSASTYKNGDGSAEASADAAVRAERVKNKGVFKNEVAFIDCPRLLGFDPNTEPETEQIRPAWEIARILVMPNDFVVTLKDRKRCSGHSIG